MTHYYAFTKAMLLAVLGLMAVGNAWAQSPDVEETMYVLTKASAEADAYSLDEVDKITFSEKGIQIWNTSWPTEYAYTNFRVLTFNVVPSWMQPVAVQSVKENQEGGEVFNLQGRRLSALGKGVNIVRMKDGTARKVLVK